jgi:AcrR family transcriptional regulator
VAGRQREQLHQLARLAQPPCRVRDGGAVDGGCEAAEERNRYDRSFYFLHITTGRVNLSTGMTAATTPRRRRSDGERSRRTILQTAARLATVEGLDGISIGRLAEASGISKGGLYAHFGSKEELQLATIATAGEIFDEHVVSKALEAPPGRTRLVALTDAFLDYLEHRVFPGGCFFAAAAVEFGARPCRVKEALAEFQRGWAGLLERQIEEARDELPPATDASQLAFELNGMLLAANSGFLFTGDPALIERARRGIERLLAG